ncbi:MAG: EAL domain-containing protein [Spirochaetales bacterium]|nr:EAL domain-containing protein [Spirochaetales bacterium]
MALGAGFFLNTLSIGFDGGVSFYAGGIFTLLIFLAFPFSFLYACLGALIINSALIGKEYSLLLPLVSLLEISFLRMAQKRDCDNHIGIDGVFWLVLGSPIAFLLGHFVYPLSSGESLFLAFSLSFNGVVCLTAAEGIYYGWYLVRVRILRKRDLKPFPIKKLLFNVVSLGFMILALFVYAQEYDHYTSLASHNLLLLFLLVMVIGAFGAALYFSQLLSQPLIKLTGIMEALSREGTDELELIHWPVSTIAEVQDLINYSQVSYGNIIERNIQLVSLNRSLEYSAHYDGLTKLPNRTLIQKRLEGMIRKGELFSLVFLDLDGFKMLNDTHGHRTGDALLVEFAYRLTQLGKDYFASRMGGDEFALIIEGVDYREALEGRLALLNEQLAKPIDVNGELYTLHSSMGAALSPQHGATLTALLKSVDLALYKAQAEGTNHWYIYSEELDNALTQYEIERGIYKAFEESQFELYYQPQVDIRSGEIVSLEALIRWNHPDQGRISPSLFIPLAERMDIIIPLGYWVIEEAAKMGKALVERGFKGVVSVNVSPRQFSESNFFISTKEILERIGLAPEYFGIEVTETMVMGNVKFTNRVISRFMNYGVHVSIDDFGTGYTSLSLLQDLNVHTLKIDQAFVKQVGRNRKNEIVLNNIINLTRELEMDIVVEGVETEEQSNFFKDRACYTLQGFLHHKPLGPEELKQVLRKASDFR